MFLQLVLDIKIIFRIGNNFGKPTDQIVYVSLIGTGIIVFCSVQIELLIVTVCFAKGVRNQGLDMFFNLENITKNNGTKGIVKNV